MRVENPAAFRFIIDEDLYLLNKDKFPPTIPTLSLPILPSIETQSVDFKYLGGNKKNFLIIVYYPDEEFIHSAHLTALENILKRKALELDDVAILNLATHAATTHEEIMTHFKPQRLLLMGDKTLLPATALLALNQPKQVANCQALYSFSFDEMMDSNDNKRVFWEQMKTL